MIETLTMIGFILSLLLTFIGVFFYGNWMEDWTQGTNWKQHVIMYIIGGPVIWIIMPIIFIYINLMKIVRRLK